MENNFKETIVGKIPNEWQLKTVAELIEENILDKPLDGNHGGIHPKKSDFVEMGVPFIMASDLKNGVIDYSGCSHITEEQAKTLKKGFAKENDVLITHKATIGETAIVEGIGDKTIILTPQVTYYRVKDYEKLNNKYLMYYFNYYRFKELFANWAGGGSTRSYLGITAQQKLPIVLPKIESQRKIAYILSSLDNKIKLNNEMNKTLEEMAQAIFKSWFIDFEPFKDGEFEESELGMIPKGWKICLLKDISNITMGQSPSSETYNENREGLAFYQGVKDFTDRFPLVSTYCREPKKVAMVGEILLSVRAPVGRINISMEKCCIGRGCAALSSEKYGNGFLYYLLRNIKWDKYESGTVFTSIKKSDIENYKVIIPNIEIINKFNKIINSLDNRILNNSVQNRDLEAARDTLLPKLISGEIPI